MSRQRDKLVIAHDFTRQKYYPLGEPLPYEGRPDMLRDVLERLLPEVEIVLPLSRDDTTAALAGADFLDFREVGTPKSPIFHKDWSVYHTCGTSAPRGPARVLRPPPCCDPARGPLPLRYSVHF